MKRPFVVGISGGIGSGKSAATRAFERFGARVIDADRIVHEVLAEPAIRAAIRARFGDAAILGESVNRAVLAAAVFGTTPLQEAARRDLEAIVHPRTLLRIEDALAAHAAATPPPKVVILDVPLLLETPLRDRCEAIVFVDAPEADRLARTRATRGWTADQHRARERAQMPVDARRRAATHVIDNHGSIAELESACEALFRAWTATP